MSAKSVKKVEVEEVAVKTNLGGLIAVSPILFGLFVMGAYWAMSAFQGTGNTTTGWIGLALAVWVVYAVIESLVGILDKPEVVNEPLASDYDPILFGNEAVDNVVDGYDPQLESLSTDESREGLRYQ